MSKQILRRRSLGFTVAGGFMVFVLVLLTIAGGRYLYVRHQDAHQRAAADISPPGQTYAGWKTTCDAQAKACYKYPADWAASPYGGFQNSSDTAYVSLYADNKDQAEQSVAIESVNNTARQDTGVRIIGYTYGSTPMFTVYDQQVARALAVGQSAQLTTTNPTFQGNRQGDAITFVATPGSKGMARITSPDQAKAWFQTDEAKTCLKVLQSLYYQ